MSNIAMLTTDSSARVGSAAGRSVVGVFSGRTAVVVVVATTVASVRADAVGDPLPHAATRIIAALMNVAGACAVRNRSISDRPFGVAHTIV
jgi:hypothetical protein